MNISVYVAMYDLPLYVVQLVAAMLHRLLSERVTPQARRRCMSVLHKICCRLPVVLHVAPD